MTHVLSAVRNLYPIRWASRPVDGTEHGCLNCGVGCTVHNADFITGWAHKGRCTDRVKRRIAEPLNLFEGTVALGIGIVLSGVLILIGVQIGTWIARS